MTVSLSQYFHGEYKYELAHFQSLNTQVSKNVLACLLRATDSLLHCTQRNSSVAVERLPIAQDYPDL